MMAAQVHPEGPPATLSLSHLKRPRHAPQEASLVATPSLSSGPSPPQVSGVGLNTNRNNMDFNKPKASTE